jgi:hypothetical protein
MHGVGSGPSRRNGYRLHIVTDISTDIANDRQHAKKARKGQPTAFLLLLHNQVKVDRLRNCPPVAVLERSRHRKRIRANRSTWWIGSSSA